VNTGTSNLVYMLIVASPTDDKMSLKGAWFGSFDPFLYAQLWT